MDSILLSLIRERYNSLGRLVRNKIKFKFRSCHLVDHHII